MRWSRLDDGGCGAIICIMATQLVVVVVVDFAVVVGPASVASVALNSV